MPVLKPYVFASVQAFNQKYLWYLNRPPVVLTTLAGDLQNSDSGGVDDGRYHPVLGVVHGPGFADPHDTAITGTASRSSACRFFTKTSGTADTNWRDPVNNNWGILCNDGTPTGTYDLLANHIHGSIETTQLTLWRGPPAYLAGTPSTAANCYTIIELCTGSTRNFRLLIAFAKTICLQFTEDGGTTWKTVSSLVGSRGQEIIFSAQDSITFYFLPNLATGCLTIDTSAGGTMRWTPNDTFTLANPRSLWLPATGRFRVYGQNGWAAFTVNSKRHQPAQVTRTDDLKYVHPQAAGAWLSINSLTDQGAQIPANTIVNTGSAFAWRSQVGLPNNADGLGSDDPPEWTDGQLIIPPDWTLGVPGAPYSPAIVQLAVAEMRVTEVLDENQRTFTSDGDLTLNNDGHRYAPAAGHLALTLYSDNSDGGTLYKRGEFICGISDEGFLYENANCLNDLLMRFADRSFQMGNGKDVPIGYELQLDGWAFWSAFRLLCHLAGVHNIWLQRLPDVLSGAGIYVPPGGAATVDYPYGKADPSYTAGPILANGTGDNPLHVYGASMTPWQILQQLVQDRSTSTYAGGTLVKNVPWVFGFDVDGYMLCYPFDPTLQSSVCGFTDNNPIFTQSVYPIVPWVGMTRFAVGYSVANLRSELTVEGQDWLTNELLIEHRDQPASVKGFLGFPVRLLARQERWGDQQYLSDVADGIETETSLPVAIAALSCPHVPSVHAGDRISILHPNVSTLGPVDFYATMVQHELRDGADRQGTTHIIARALANF